MIKVDLITGFLGSGKTTFLKKYARYFMEKGQKVGILENDYGAVNVDMLLLNELRGEKCELEMVAGGCDADCHLRRFKTKLIAMAMTRYDRVIVEPSGVFDMDEFFDVLREEPLDRWYEIGNVIAIVDARLEEQLSAESEYYLASEVANAGAIILSRTQMTTPEQIEAVKEHLKRAGEMAKVRRPWKATVWTKDWQDFTERDMRMIAGSEYCIASYVKLIAGQQAPYSTVYFLDVPMDTEGLKEKIHELMGSDRYGQVFRMKGFYQENGQWYQVNATRKEIDIAEIPVGQQVLIVIGENLKEEEIKKVF